MTAARVRFAWNPFRRPTLPPEEDTPAAEEVRAFHGSLPGYAPTPLVALPGLAAELGLGEVWLKDESRRFGLNAFKALGAAYAVQRVLREGGVSTVATATAGNHGRAVAWAARVAGKRAVVFVPAHTVPARIEIIRLEGADVVVVDGTYDDAVRRAAEESARRGWQVVSDTAYPGYAVIPRWIMAGYGTLFAEMTEQLQARGRPEPDVVFLQAGVGGLACAGTRYYLGGDRDRRPRLPPRLVVVEPTEAACLLESIVSSDGEMRVARGSQRTIMAGLNAATPSPAAWPSIRAGIDLFLAVADTLAEDAMRRLHRGSGGDARVVAGETGAAGLAGLLALCREPGLTEARSALGLGPEAAVLLISTEGATDPASYRKIVGAEPR
ncbi:MAG: diaminopropionate ammonia-lyase [Candidatus Rokuibacteriota bacterium]